ncbi:MAG: glycosyltransferase, partial [Planctomycetota bacterium]
MRHGVIILGMHRSGTSAMAGTLRLLGVELGPRLMPGRVDDNTKGFFEHDDVVNAHDRLLASAGYTWDDPRSLPPQHLTGDEALPFCRELAEILRTTFSGAALWAVKDPRLCRLLPAWSRILDDIGCTPRFVVIHRRASEVAASLHRRDGFSREKSALLWADHVLQAERYTRGHRRVLVSFDRLLQDPATTLEAVARMLELTWPRPWAEAAHEVADFLTPAPRHQLADDGAAGADHGRLTSIVSAVEAVLPWTGPSDGAELTSPFDDARRELAGVLDRLDPLLIQHVAQMSQRFHETQLETALRSQAQTDEIRRRTHELGQARETVVRLSAVLDERTDLAERQKQELIRLRESIFVRRHGAVGAVWWRLTRGWQLFSRAVRSPRKARSALVSRARILWQHQVAPRVTPARRPLRQDMTPKPVTRRRLERIELPIPQRPQVSVIIPAFNQAKLTARCLESIAAAAGETTFEVILVDDASTEAAVAALRQVAGLRVVTNEINLGFVDACNHGAREARGRYLLFLNNDTTVTDGWIDRLIQTFDRFNDVGLVGAKLVYPNGTIQEAGGIVWQDGTAWNYGLGLNPQTPECNYAREVDYCSGACLMIPRELFLDLGMFDPRYAPAYYEDTDLAFRVREAGKRVVYQPTALVYHIEGATAGTSTNAGVKHHQ